MTNGGQIDVILMDLAKAFDKLDHNILLHKLNAMPLNPCLIALIQSYLTERKQYISVHGELSNCITPNSSVPLGSVLSPLLFALFINDLPPLIKAKILLFADDLKIFIKITSHDDARLLQNDIETIVNWCNINNLQLNIGKCNTMSFTRKLPANTHTFNYNINGHSLNRVNSCEDLGVIFDSKLTFEQHCKNITSRAYKVLGFISRSLNKFKLMSTYNTLYNMYVRSIVDYCSSIWNPHCGIYIETVENIQHRFTRMLYRKFHYPYEPYPKRLLRLEMVSLENRRRLTDELTLYKIHNGQLKTSLTQDIRFHNPIRATRQNITFYLQPVTTNIEYFAPLLRMQRQHNESFNLVQLDEPNINAFKRYITFEIKQIQENI